MDRYDLVLDIIEHPEKYRAERLQEIMSDPETREIYNLMCGLSSAVNSESEPDVSKEWETFSRRHIGRRHLKGLLWRGNRAASLLTLALSSIAAVAIGIVLSVVIPEKGTEPPLSKKEEPTETSVTTKQTAEEKTDSATVKAVPVLFEDESLEVIMETIATAYAAEVRFDNADAASLHLYYKFDPSLSLNDIISQLNTFEQINISRRGNTLTIY